MCKDTEDCRSAPMTWAIDNGFSDTSIYGTNANIIGVAKDGHLIYGPYDENEELWDCADHDVCNGTFIDGNYVYLSTTTFPFILGCWGPGASQLYEADCSSDSCYDTYDTDNASSDSSSSSSSSSSDDSTDDAAVMTTLTALSTALIALIYF